MQNLATSALNLGLISGVADNIADFNACATTEEQAYCVSKAKSYGVFTGVNGNAYNRCIADICAAKQPELVNQSELTNLIGGITATAIGVGIFTPTVIAAEMLTPLNLSFFGDLADATKESLATSEENNISISVDNNNVHDCLTGCATGFYDLPEPVYNLGLISEVANDITDIYACATTEEQAYCVSKAKSYGIFTGVNGSKYNKCIADICAAKQPELTNLIGFPGSGLLIPGLN